MSSGSTSRTHLLKYSPADPAKSSLTFEDTPTTHTVGDFLRAIVRDNDCSEFAETTAAEEPIAHMDAGNCRLVLCMQDQHDTLFHVLEGEILLSDIPGSCAGALMLFTDFRALRQTLNVAHGPAPSNLFDFCAQNLPPLGVHGELPQVHKETFPRRHHVDSPDLIGAVAMC